MRARALEAIVAYRDGGCVLPDPPSPAVIHEMMNVLVAGEVPDEYVPLMLEELELDGRGRPGSPLDATNRGRPTPTDSTWWSSGRACPDCWPASGWPRPGFAYTIVEKNPGVGGTWWENRYPGCRVDVGNHFYCYSFAANDDWTEFFARQPELQTYFEECMDRFGLAEHIRFGTEVIGARWDEDTASWSVEVADRDGTTVIGADALISAVGQLNRPQIPDLPGRHTFRGLAMHSAQWVEGTELAGKRVAVIGTGASAFQIVPTIAPEVDHLTVFQRSAPWMFPNPHYHDPVGPGARWAFEHLPFYGRWYRFLLFWPACDGGLPAMRIDPDWPDQSRSISALNDAARQMFTQWMADQIGDDDELLAKVVPDYVCLGKRTLQDNGSWLSALVQDHVDLVTDPIAAITPDGVRTQNGEEVPVDVIIYATGFHANRYLWPMEIVGRDGRRLADQWGERPTAYLGITVPGFPNLFCVYGPGTNLAHGGSIIFHSECQVRYIMGCLATLVEGAHSSLEVRQDVHDEYNRRLQAELDTMVWSHPSIRHSWYRNAENRIYVLSPWRLVDYWEWTKAPDPDDYLPGAERPLPSTSAAAS